MSAGATEVAALKVIDVLLAVDRRFPFAHAASGDKVGLLIGDANAEVTGVLTCLDPGLDALARAQELGANLIVSHHPVRFNNAGYFNVSHVANTYPERVLAEALRAGIAVIAAHTNVDVDEVARRYWGDKLGFEHAGPLPALVTELMGMPTSKNVDDLAASEPYGEMWRIGKPVTLNALAVLVAEAAGCSVKVYGGGETLLETAVTATGSGGGRIAEAQVAGVDVIISGEFGYHAALGAVESGMCLIELGHDVSELPLVNLIRNAISLGTDISDDLLYLEDRPALWHTVLTGSK